MPYCGHAPIHTRGQEGLGQGQPMEVCNPDKIKGLCPKPFYGRNAITRANLPQGTVPGAPLSDGKTFYGLYLYFAGRCCQNLQSAGGSAQCKSGRAIT